MWHVPVALVPRLRWELHTSLGKTVIPCLVVQVVMCTCNPSNYREAEAGGLLKWGQFRLQNEFEASLNYITRFCLNPQIKTKQHWLLQRLSGQTDVELCDQEQFPEPCSRTSLVSRTLLCCKTKSLTLASPLPLSQTLLHDLQCCRLPHCPSFSVIRY